MVAVLPSLTSNIYLSATKKPQLSCARLKFRLPLPAAESVARRPKGGIDSANICSESAIWRETGHINPYLLAITP